MVSRLSEIPPAASPLLHLAKLPRAIVHGVEEESRGLFDDSRQFTVGFLFKRSVASGTGGAGVSLG